MVTAVVYQVQMNINQSRFTVAVIGGAIIVAGAFVAFGLLRLADETKMASACPNRWFQMGIGWRCHGELYPGAMEREKMWADFAQTTEGRNAALRRTCDLPNNKVEVDVVMKTADAAAYELCLERLARYRTPLVN
jgi:hypothetical protein